MNFEPQDDSQDRIPLWMWVVVSVMLALMWLSQIASKGLANLDWSQICLGAISGGIFIIWGHEMTGGKLPDWMRPPPSKRYLPDPIKGEPAFYSGRARVAALAVTALCITAFVVWLRA